MLNFEFLETAHCRLCSSDECQEILKNLKEPICLIQCVIHLELL